MLPPAGYLLRHRLDTTSNSENLNLADLDLKKLNLSEEDALALSCLTPGLSKRIQQQLLAELTPSEVRKLQRTLSSRTSDEIQKEPKVTRRSADCLHSTLPRRTPLAREPIEDPQELKLPAKNPSKSFLPVKFNSRCDDRPSYEYNVRSCSTGAEPKGDCKFLYRRPRSARSVGVRDSRIGKPDLMSPDSSISESLGSRNDDTSASYSLSSRYSDSSASRPYSKYSSDASYSRFTPSQSPASSTLDLSKTDKKSSQRRISRFLRPDFFDSPKEENFVEKEKKQREMETQKVLKEIRDKRKGRFRSVSRDNHSEKKEAAIAEDSLLTKDISKKDLEFSTNNKPTVSKIHDYVNTAPEPSIGKNVHDYVNVTAQTQESKMEKPSMEEKPDSKSNKNLVNSTKALHDYVNVKVAENSTPSIKKERMSRIARPKSYPTEDMELINKDTNDNKINSKQNKTTEKGNVVNKVQVTHNYAPENLENAVLEREINIDNKLKTKISPDKESKISKLKKGFSKKEKPSKEDKNETNKTINEEDKGHKNKLLQSIEKKLEKFRSNNIAATKDPDEAKALLEKKSMVESAINRLREQSVPPLTPCTESNLIKRAVSVEDMAIGSKPLQTSRKSVTKILGLFKKYEEQDKKKEKSLKKLKSKENIKNSNKQNGVKDSSPEASSSTCNDSERSERKERPKSLLFDKMKNFQSYNGAKSDSILNGNEKEPKVKSKLPVTSFRRSLNLDHISETPKLYKNSSVTENLEPKPDKSNSNTQQKPDRSKLRLDLTKTANKNVDPVIIIDQIPGPNQGNYHNFTNENRNSLATTDDSSTIFSPTDDYLSCDSWSACSDYHHLSDLNSPVTHPNSHVLYSGDESESVIDRIRRKSFYTRFNDRKKPTRKPSLQSYKDLDLYKSDYGRSDYAKPDYSSLDRYRSPSVSKRSGYNSYKPDATTSTTKEYKPYVRSVSALNDYVNVPGSYQTYSSRIGRPTTSRTLYSDSESSNLDDLLNRSRRHLSPTVTHRQPSISRVGSVSPVGDQYFLSRPSTSLVSPSTSEPI